MNKTVKIKIPIKVTHPSIAKYWKDEYGVIDEHTADSELVISVKCRDNACDKHWIKESIKVLTTRNLTSLCKQCCYRQTICCEKGCNSLGSLQPKLMKEWHPDNELDKFNLRPKSGKKAKWICNKCNNIWITKIINRVKYGHGCSKCKMSKIERNIEEELEDECLDYEVQKKFDKCAYKLPLRFDFYVKKYNLCIEGDGTPHFESNSMMGGVEAFKKRVLSDIYKDEFCEKSNINLLRISHLHNNNDAIYTLLKKTLKEIKKKKGRVEIYSDPELYKKTHDLVKTDFKHYKARQKLEQAEFKKIISDKKKGELNPNYGLTFSDNRTFKMSKSIMSTRRSYTDKQILEVRTLIDKGTTITSLIGKYNMSKDTLSKIKHRELLPTTEHTKEAFVLKKRKKEMEKQTKKILTKEQIKKRGITKNSITRRNASADEIINILKLSCKGQTESDIVDTLKKENSLSTVTLDTVKNIKNLKTTVASTESEYEEYKKAVEYYKKNKDTNQTLKDKSKAQKCALARRKLSPVMILEILQLTKNTKLTRAVICQKMIEKHPSTKFTNSTIKNVKSGKTKILDCEPEYEAYIRLRK